MSDEDALGAALINVRVLANKQFCERIAATLEPLGLIITGFKEDPYGNAGVFRMFLVGHDVDRSQTGCPRNE